MVMISEAQRHPLTGDIWMGSHSNSFTGDHFFLCFLLQLSFLGPDRDLNLRQTIDQRSNDFLPHDFLKPSISFFFGSSAFFSKFFDIHSFFMYLSSLRYNLSEVHQNCNFREDYRGTSSTVIKSNEEDDKAYLILDDTAI